MLGSIFIGLSGMNAFSGGLRQISNNITNINTTGFKTANLLFSDHFGVGDRTGNSGQGVSLTKPTIDFAQGELRQSDRDLDLAIDGNGFLVLLKDAEKFFIRTGSFEINDKGDIVLAGTQYRLTVVDEAGKLTPVSVAAFRTSPPKKTTNIKLADNLSSTATDFTLPNVKVFDAQGASVDWTVKFTRGAQAAPGEWTATVSEGATEIGVKTLKFIGGTVDPTTAQLTFEQASSGRSATLDFSSNVTSFSSGAISTLRVAESDGFGPGDITTVTVTAEGILEIAYSNQQKKQLGAVAIASLPDPQELQQRDGGLFALEHESNEQFLTSKHELVGRVVSKRLEASNVDLSREFGDLILVQRGYQASSQVVSVSNDMIQQLFGIRGQG
jgi:flagellar hook protein FlgE